MGVKDLILCIVQQWLWVKRIKKYFQEYLIVKLKFIILILFILALTFPIPAVILDNDSNNIEYTNIQTYPDEDVKILELLAIQQAEAVKTSLALETINRAIDLCPEDLRASLYNNKAQILRLIGGDESINEALKLLDSVIKLSGANNNKRVLRLSSAQRAWINFRAGRTEEAFKDFELAGKLGCGESKRMAVRCNPYAAMCNQFMQEILGSTFYSK